MQDPVHAMRRLLRGTAGAPSTRGDKASLLSDIVPLYRVHKGLKMSWVRRHDGCALRDRPRGDQNVDTEAVLGGGCFARPAQPSPQIGGGAPGRGSNGNVTQLPRQLVETREARR